MNPLKRLFAPLATLFLAACASPAPAEPAARPAMWKLSDPDTTIYLFGTIHILPKDFAWRTKRFEQAAAAADTLVLEIADQSDPAASAGIFRTMAASPGLPPLLDRVPEEQRPALAKLIKKAGLAENQLDGFETWAAALTLGASLYTDIGLSAEQGVERQLTAQFTGKKKPIEGLETTPQQLGYFDTLPEAAQRRLLTSMIEEAEGAADQFEAMASAWSSGDVDKIAVTFDDEMRLSPDLAGVLLHQRNAQWADWVEQRMAKPGTVLVAVGAGHLAGDRSVVELLEARGLKVERVQ
jgi:uncharacterized protein YbaP (TraB family)